MPDFIVAMRQFCVGSGLYFLLLGFVFLIEFKHLQSQLSRKLIQCLIFFLQCFYFVLQSLSLSGGQNSLTRQQTQYF